MKMYYQWIAKIIRGVSRMLEVLVGLILGIIRGKKTMAGVVNSESSFSGTEIELQMKDDSEV